MKKTSVKKSVPSKAKKGSSPKKAATGLAKKPSKNKSTTVHKKTPLVVKTPFNRSVLMSTLVERTELNKKQVLSVLESLTEIMIAHLAKKGPGQFKWPGILMMKIKDKPATKARKGINPFTGQETTFAAKPAQRLIKIKPLKILKQV